MDTNKALTPEEQQAISNLVNVLSDAADKSESYRAEILKRLSTFVEGVKLGLVTKQEP